ncbi:MAG: ABC transporter permease [Acidobacteria bacterium]|nr:ABC transporter permease [Acidobacteriota bacterium]MCW5971018.1 ABC transporter permease [Blastocatellales bacterium]
METLRQDLRFSLRMLWKNPTFTAVAVITLALGIGANSAIFSVVNAVLLKPLAYANPEQLVLINHNYPKINLRASVSAFGYVHYRDNAKSFSSVAALSGWPANLTGEGEPERLSGIQVTPNLFMTLGAHPAMGRVFAPDEDQTGKNRVVVLSHAFWQRRFGGDPSILNRQIALNGENHTIIGVMPATFQFGRELGQITDLWAPLVFTPEQLTPARLTFEFLFVLARLKDGVTMQQAQSEMDAIAASLREQYAPGQDSSNWNLLVSSFREMVIGEIRTSLLVLLGAVAVVLLIACANVANLLLARAAARSREMAVRAALGAGGRRLIRQLLTESVLLSLAGGLLGLGLGYALVRTLVTLNENRIPRAHEIGLDPWVFGFTLVVSIGTGLLFGLAPALQATRIDLHETLKEGGRSGAAQSRRTLRAGLVIAEMALALVLLIGAGLLIKSFSRVQAVNPGFRPEGLISMQVSLPMTKYPEPAQRDAFYDSALERVRALPGVESAAGVSVLPLSGSNQSGSFQIEGRVVPQGQSSPHGDRWAATSDYFKTMGITLIRGRLFDERDTADSPGVAIVDESLAQKYFPDEDPVGKRITFEGGRDNPRWREIVGLVRHVKHRGLEGESRVQYYIPYHQQRGQNLYLVARTAQEDPTAIAGSIRGAIREIDRELPVFRVQTLEQYVQDSMTQRRFALYLFGIFAGIAALLAAVGLYGVMAYSVAQRTHEIGIRMALGANRTTVVRMVLRQGMTLAGAGVVAGLGAAFGLTRLMESLLFGVSARDLAVFSLIAAGLAAVAAAACLLPARRATRVDPLVALRYE